MEKTDPTIHNLSGSEKEMLKNYKYNCEDHSFIANHILKYYWTWISKFFPSWIAPNLITLMGLVCMIISMMVTILFDPMLIGKGGRLLPLSNGILLFMYSTFDNVDGKQARRTGEMTPLGQLMDHGVDSLCCFFSLIGLASSLRLGTTFDSICLLFCLLICFYGAAVEEHFTNIFRLGIVNGATEGIIAGVIVHLLASTGCTEFTWLRQPLPLISISNISFISILFMIAFNILTIMQIPQKARFKAFLILFRIYLLFFSMIIYYSRCSFYLTFFTLMFNFALMGTLTVFSHLIHRSVPHITPPMGLFILGSVITLFIPPSKPYISYLNFLHSIIVYFVNIIAIIRTITKILDIKVFKIRNKSK
ncbi:Choline/ethanolaminephosphotransferase 1 [Astathelohania contejeani]|uniref:Choline/ethanolaminephosphotransferase 1 n=1 Tax=Astathelohania contejeani TaxID=164912 RepID=A0ABQ7HW30_9MICR|nr:Choline/ethanolaminephosphotransferase 1 [Thelohania contejeani]